MDRNTILRLLMQQLMEYQLHRPNPEEGEVVQPDTRPVGDLADFDSYSAVEMTVTCLARFGIEDDNSIQSLFVEDRTALTVDDVAGKIHELMKNAEKQK